MLQLRELGPDDTEFLGAMLYAALFWTPRKERLPVEVVLAHPQVSIFHEGWGRPGDAGLVAECRRRRRRRGLVPALHRSGARRGFVDERTPELAIAIVEGRRGEGIGRALMEAILGRMVLTL